MNTKHWSRALGTELDWVEEEYLSLNLEPVSKLLVL